MPLPRRRKLLARFPLGSALGLLPARGAGELALEDPVQQVRPPTSGLGLTAYQHPWAAKRHLSPRVHVPSFQNLQLLLIFLGALSPFGETDNFLRKKGQLLPRLQVPCRKS